MPGISTIRTLIFFICYCYGFTTYGQIKFEREYRIKPEQVPGAAMTFIDSCFKEQKVKWYVEESQDGKTYEAKTFFNNTKYSIEFDTIGNPLDVEQKIAFKRLKNDLKNDITATLDALFVKHQIIKTQIQWKADRETLLKLIKNSSSTESYALHYEIILKAKKEGVFKKYEILFDSSGTAQKVLEITQRPTDNLEF